MFSWAIIKYQRLEIMFKPVMMLACITINMR